MFIQENISLKIYNTFGIDVSARHFIRVDSIDDLKFALNWAKENQLEILLLNGGSNMLLTKNWDGLAIKINLKGMQILKEDEDFVWVETQAGENWNDFVQWAISQDYGGIENLSLIPGNCGTSPMQNIGAYGMEIKDRLTQVEALEIATGELKTFTKEECAFGYRESVFKNKLKNQFVLVSVQFKLTKHSHELKMDYGDIQQELKDLGLEPSIQSISQAIIRIRESKLPDTNELGNAGSFFKNPLISNEHFEKLKAEYPDIKGFPVNDETKVPAGWLIEKAGWKGKRFGDAGVHAKQALVLVNYGNATGKEIYDLSQQVIDDIQAKFGIELEREVNIY